MLRLQREIRCCRSVRRWGFRWQRRDSGSLTSPNIPPMPRARELGCHALAEQALQIADTPCLGVVRTTKADGGIEERMEDMTSHRKLQIDTRKWLISRWLPKVYGERTTVSGDPEAPLETKATLDVSGLPTEVLVALMKAKDAADRG